MAELQSKDRKKATRKPDEEPKKPVPKAGGLKGYTSVAEKSLQKTVDTHTTMLFCCIVLIILSLVMGIINVVLVKSISNNTIATTLDEWVECTLENYVGYKVKKEWKTMGYEDSVIFQPTDTTAVAVGTKSVEAINRNEGGVKLSHATLREYIEADLKTIGNEPGYSVDNITFEEYVVLGTTGYRYTFSQTTPTENQSVKTYTDSVFFIYEGYLYTFSYTSAVMGYAIPEYEYLLSSIRLIPSTERPTMLPSGDFNEDIVDDYKDLGESITSTTPATTTKPTEATFTPEGTTASE